MARSKSSKNTTKDVALRVDHGGRGCGGRSRRPDVADVQDNKVVVAEDDLSGPTCQTDGRRGVAADMRNNKENVAPPNRASDQCQRDGSRGLRAQRPIVVDKQEEKEGVAPPARAPDPCSDHGFDFQDCAFCLADSHHREHLSEARAPDPCSQHGSDLRENCPACLAVFLHREAAASGESRRCSATVSAAAARLPGYMNVTVRLVSGAELTTLQCSLNETVYEVKQRLGSLCGVAPGQQHLVFGQAVLRNHDSLACCGMTGVEACVQLVRNRPSGISRVLESRRDCVDENNKLECTMADLCDSILQCEHRLSERQRPRAAYLERAMSFRRRSELICWMLQAFDVLQFDDGILHSTVLTLDRYYAKQASAIADASLQRMLLAAICTVMKMANADEFPTLHWRRVVAHLCQGQVETIEILKQETKMLGRLGFIVDVPTPVNFLRGLMVRVREATPGPDATRWENFAVFLLELALFDAPLAYGFPHIALAAGALSAACRGCGAPPEQQEELLEDVSAYYPTLHTGDAEQIVLECEGRLLSLWAQCERGENTDVGPFYATVKAKFSRNSRQGVALMSPVDILRRLDMVMLMRKDQQAGASGFSVPIGLV